MNKVLKQFKQFIANLESKNTNKSHLELVYSFCKEIEKHQKEIKNPEDLEELLRSSKTKKENKRDLILKFYGFLEDECGILIDTDLHSKMIYDDELERKIALIEYMQMNRVKLQELADLFMMSTKSMKKMLDELADGIEILGTTVKIEMDKDNRNFYSVISYHPVFLNLNMTEVLALTVGLNQAAENNKLYGPLFRKIAKDVYDNLTEYAKSCINKMPNNQAVPENEETSFEELISGSILTMVKEEIMGTVRIHEGDNDYIFESCRIRDYQRDIIFLETRDGEVKQFNVSDVYSCDYSFNRNLQ